jgi:hypothetical protein
VMPAASAVAAARAPSGAGSSQTTSAGGSHLVAQAEDRGLQHGVGSCGDDRSRTREHDVRVRGPRERSRRGPPVAARRRAADAASRATRPGGRRDGIDR